MGFFGLAKRCLFKIRLVSYVIFRVIHYMEMTMTMARESGKNPEFEKLMKNLAFYQR